MIQDQGMSHSNTAEIIDAVVSQDDVVNAQEHRASSSVRKLIGIPLFLNLFVLTFFMGGVRASAYYTVSAITYASLLALTLSPSAQPYWREIFARSWVRAIVLAVIFAAGFGALQLTVLAQGTASHPVLGSVSMILNAGAGWTVVSGFLYFAATFILCLLATSVFTFEVVTKWLIRLCWLVCITALMHWFYDTGKLFWIFEPDNSSPADRARWPFVNPNHLGHFCLLLSSAVILTMRAQFDKLEGALLKERDNRLGPIVKRFSQPRVQHYCWNVMVSAIVLSAVLLTIFGTLSRSTWLGLSVTISLLFAALAAKHFKSLFAPSKSHRKASLATRYKLLARKLATVLLFVSAIAATLVFLQGRGSELVQDRIIYGLTKSKEDLRWLLYSESKPIFEQGAIGVGQWPEVFQQREIPEISGFIPEYLHSDPYQLLIEFGIVPFSLFVLLILAGVGLRLTSVRPTGFWILSATVFGFLVASTLDFPFRIPAINALLACILALWSSVPRKELH